MDVVSILKKSRQEVTQLEINVAIQQASEHPKKATEIKLEYLVYGKNLDENKVKHAIELSHNRYCSVGVTLQVSAPITFTYQIINE